MPKPTTNFIPLQTPANFLALFDKDILEKRVQLYNWQAKVHRDFAEEFPKGKTNELAVVAANDSGKSKMIMAPAALWSLCRFDKATTVLTTSSGTQLDKQSGRYIKDYARRVNTKFNKELFTIQHRHLHFGPTDSNLELFATDEPGKAEGWHAVDYDAALTLMVDEGKSVHNDIFQALDRCHDAQRYLIVSSPAIGTDGFFYKAVTEGRFRVHKITAYDCPHIDPAQIQKIIKTYGIHSPFTRSSIFAEFSATGDQTVITYDSLMKLQREKPLENTKGQKKRVGIDLAAGGDENVLTIFEGNKQVCLECFREPDTTKTRDRIVMILGKHGIPKDHEYIFADDGGVGHGIIDALREKGWNVTKVLNQSKPMDTRMFANRGAELWMNFATFVQHEEVILMNDVELLGQLANRYYRQSSQGKILLESKKEAKAKGHKSPDRADATVLAFTGLRAPHFSVLGNVQEGELKNSRKGLVTQGELVDFMEQVRFGEAKRFDTKSKNSIYKNSMHSMIGVSEPPGRENFEEILKLSGLNVKL